MAQKIDMQLADQAIHWLVRLQSPAIEPRELDEFEQWLATSAAHQRAYINAENLWQKGILLRQVQSRARPDVKPAGRLFGWRGGLAVAVTLASVGLFFAHGLFAPKEQHATYRTAVGEQLTVVLADSSTVELNTDSLLEFSRSGDRRIARLNRGEALFNAAKDSKRPFFVVTPTGQVRVFGTRFIVRNIADDTLVTVFEGKVGVAAIDGDSKEFIASNVLVANMQQSVQQAERGEAAAIVDPELAGAWLKQMLIYQDKTVAEVVADINRYFTQDILLADENMASRKVVLALKLKDFEATMLALAEALGLEAEFSPGNNAVTLVGKK